MYIRKLAKIVNKKRQLMDKIIKPLGFRRVEWQLLAILSSEGDLTQKYINQLMDNDPAFITRAFDKLEAKKLIKRYIDPEDKRQKLVTLTAKGRPIAKQLFNQGKKLNDQFLSGFSKAEINTLANLTKRIEANIVTYLENYDA